MKFRLAQDRFATRAGFIIPYDKLEHLLCWFLLCVSFLLAGLPRSLAAGVALVAGILWELKDAVMPWERYGFWGGDGFSWRDLVADAAGIALAVGIWTLAG